MLQKLTEIHEYVVLKKNRKIKRYLYKKINWNTQAICIFGARGTGKTTMMVQHYFEHYNDSEKALYISADHISVISHGLYEVADTYFKSGGFALYIDEIHNYPNWSLELKNILDVFSDKKIVISGSSSLMLNSGKGDLSRRLIYYELKGLSFREYLLFSENVEYKPVKLEELLINHSKISASIVKNKSILKSFTNYLKFGYFPFFLEGKEEYSNRIMNILQKVIMEDMAITFNLSQPKLPAIKKLLWLLAASKPMAPNIQKLSSILGISREYTYHYIEYLEKSGLINTVKRHGKGTTPIRKPGKIFLENPNLLPVLSEDSGISSMKGTLRETFFVNQMKINNNISIPKNGDFIINNSYLFEIGGKNKDFSQIANIEKSFLALDDIETGFKNKIPLYLFGFLY